MTDKVVPLHPKPRDCEHEWGGWRMRHEGRSVIGEQVCRKCGIGALEEPGKLRPRLVSSDNLRPPTRDLSDLIGPAPDMPVMPALRQCEREEAILWALEEIARAKAHLASAEHALALLDGGGDEVA